MSPVRLFSQLLTLIAVALAQQRSWTIHDGRLEVRTDVLDGFDETGAHRALVRASRVWIDIGINLSPFSFYGEDKLRFALLGQKGYYLGFEGLVDKYAMNIAHDITPGTNPPLGTLQLLGGRYKAKKPISLKRHQGMILPMAVADLDNQMATFHVSPDDRCSSLNEQTPAGEQTPSNEGGLPAVLVKGCGKTKSVRSVPTITLASVLATWLAGRSVHFLKVDAQGSELSVLRSGRDHLRQVERFQLEVPTGHCHTLTKDAPSCDTIRDYASSKGFVTESHGVQTQPIERNFTCGALSEATRSMASRCEMDVLFVRSDVAGSYRDVKPAE